MDTPAAKPGCLLGLGALGILLAAVTAPMGLLSLASDPFQALVWLATAVLGFFLFVRAWQADRRWRAAERRTVRRHPPAGGAEARSLPSANGDADGDALVERALQTFLDAPIAFGSLVFDGPGMFHLQFSLLPTDAHVLLGQVVAITQLDPTDRPGQDAWLGLVAMGWAAPSPPAREDFAAEWTMPVDVHQLAKFVRATVTIYGFDVGLLRPSLGNTRSGPPRVVPATAAASSNSQSSILSRWSGYPTTRRAGLVVAVGFVVLLLVVGRDGLRDLLRAFPVPLYGAVAIWFLVVAVRFLNRFLTTADPFSVSGWSTWRQRTTTTYARHAWWGIFGVVIGAIGIFFFAQALIALEL